MTKVVCRALVIKLLKFDMIEDAEHYLFECLSAKSHLFGLVNLYAINDYMEILLLPAVFERDRNE